MKILQYINPPPPIGGVTISVKNLNDSLVAAGKCSTFRSGFNKNVKYDVGHVHASNPYKRLFQLLYLKIFCRKVIFTVHGLWLNDNKINRLGLHFSNGVIFLNNKLYEEWASKVDSNMIVLPSLFREGISIDTTNKKLKSDKKTLLLYSHSRTYKNNQEVYGIEFALNSILKADEKYKVILIDLYAGYSELVNKLRDRIDIDYYPHAVNFAEMLSVCDIYLRPTCMDGSSLAVQEALLQGKRVIASDVVDRGDMVELYEYLNEKDFIATINEKGKSGAKKYTLSSVNQYLKYVSSL